MRSARLGRFILSIALGIFPALGTGCGDGEFDQGAENVVEKSDYTVDMAAFNGIFNPATPYTSLEDAYTAEVTVGDKTLSAPTHLFGESVNVIPYSNEDGVKAADGETFSRGD